MKAVIIGSGVIADYNIVCQYVKDAWIICCDGGAAHAERLGIRPDIIIGDMDSIEDRLVKFYKEKGVVFEIYSKAKDYSDMELGLNRALSQGADSVYFLGATGGRLDHTISNFGLLYKCLDHGVLAWIVDGYHKAAMFKDSIELEGEKGRTVSLIPFTKAVSGIITKGFKYPFNNEMLSWGETRGVSNICVSDRAGVSIKKGVMIILIILNEG